VLPPSKESSVFSVDQAETQGSIDCDMQQLVSTYFQNARTVIAIVAIIATSNVTGCPLTCCK
jgi:hypothetical protein